MESESSSKSVVFQPKQSRANKLWIFTIVIVLAVLFLEVHGNSSANFNCCISTNIESTDADVIIDHVKVGKVTRDEKGGLGGGAYRCRLPSGHHVIEIQKPAYKPLSFEFDMRREKYLEANLEKSPH